MDNNVSETLKNSIGKGEHKKLLELLEHYNIVPDNILKENERYILSSKEGTYCLKKIRTNKRKALKGLQLSHYLIQSGFNNTMDYIKTRNDNDLIKYNGTYYYLSYWMDNRKCSYSNFNDIKNVASILAKFHLKSQGYYNKYIEMDFKSYNWSSRLLKFKKTFNTIDEIITKKKIKTMFDIQYSNSIEVFEEQLELSVKLLNESNYNRILQSSQLKYTICIDDFSFKNIILGNDGNYYFICLDNVKYNMNLFDLCKLIKKALFKDEYAWDFKYAMEIIDNYNSINPLTRDEMRILLSLIIFPKRFYKLGKRRYIQKKNCGEDNYLTSLYKITKYMDKQSKFVEEYTRYYSIM